MDAASSTNDDASRPQFSNDEGEGLGVVSKKSLVAGFG
jgi:hypothetical protein